MVVGSFIKFKNFNFSTTKKNETKSKDDDKLM